LTELQTSKIPRSAERPPFFVCYYEYYTLDANIRVVVLIFEKPTTELYAYKRGEKPNKGKGKREAQGSRSF